MEYLMPNSLELFAVILAAIIILLLFLLIKLVKYKNRHILEPEENEKDFLIQGKQGFYKGKGPYPLIHTTSGNYNGECIIVGTMFHKERNAIIRTLRFSSSGYRV